MATRSKLNFRVHTNLASLLGNEYRSSEEALRELVDNAWDADAEHVKITLPGAVTRDEIVVEDDGTGMSESDVREAYLFVALGRRSRGGEKTAVKKRPVKGRKGIGKFAGLMAAEEMRLETRKSGKLTRLIMSRQDLVRPPSDGTDLEAIGLPVEVTSCQPKQHGTTVRLTYLAQHLNFPDPERLKQVLMLDYGRRNDFVIEVNGERLSIADLPGERFVEESTLDIVGPIKLDYTIATGTKPLKNAGIAIRVGGKIVGRPNFLGLDEDPEIPKRLLSRIYGEIDADGLEDVVTAGWGAITENSKAYQQVRQFVLDKLGPQIKQTFADEIKAQQKEIQQKIDSRLNLLPERRRELARIQIHRVLNKLYGETRERIEKVVEVTLDAFEHDEYWLVLQSINDATRRDVEQLASVLGEFGLVDLAVVAQQTRRRRAFLDELDTLIRNESTLEIQMHRAIENNLWVLGAELDVIASNTSMKRIVEDWAAKKYSGERASNRPDLFLLNRGAERLLLIEFKRPSDILTRDHEAQAMRYPLCQRT